MSRRTVLLVVVGLCTTRPMEQDWNNVQIHGFATQGFCSALVSGRYDFSDYFCGKLEGHFHTEPDSATT